MNKHSLIKLAGNIIQIKHLVIRVKHSLLTDLQRLCRNLSHRNVNIRINSSFIEHCVSTYRYFITATETPTSPATFLQSRKSDSTNIFKRCPDGGSGPYCCINGANNPDCCWNGGSGSTCDNSQNIVPGMPGPIPMFFLPVPMFPLFYYEKGAKKTSASINPVDSFFENSLNKIPAKQVSRPEQPKLRNGYLPPSEVLDWEDWKVSKLKSEVLLYNFNRLRLDRKNSRRDTRRTKKKNGAASSLKIISS